MAKNKDGIMASSSAMVNRMDSGPYVAPEINTTSCRDTTNRIQFGITLLVAVAHGILSIISFLETLKLTNETAKYEKGVFYVSMELCVPDSVVIDQDGTSATTNSSECNTLKWLIYACSAGLIFSAVASFCFAWIGSMVRIGKGPFKIKSATTVGFFIIIVLLQTGISTVALAEQYRAWLKAYEPIAVELEFVVKPYCNIMFLFITAGSALFTSVLIFMDITFFACCRRKEKVNDEIV
mmetsp:Transcript_19217/g.43776  ORF Transcript_19217/g.43776 Transcript_19217/m.43776 type:complete len:238 (-) Transcript_19217:74-787(-)